MLVSHNRNEVLTTQLPSPSYRIPGMSAYPNLDLDIDPHMIRRCCRSWGQCLWLDMSDLGRNSFGEFLVAQSVYLLDFHEFVFCNGLF